MRRSWAHHPPHQPERQRLHITEDLTSDDHVTLHITRGPTGHCSFGRIPGRADDVVDPVLQQRVLRQLGVVPPDGFSRDVFPIRPDRRGRQARSFAIDAATSRWRSSESTPAWRSTTSSTWSTLIKGGGPARFVDESVQAIGDETTTPLPSVAASPRLRRHALVQPRAGQHSLRAQAQCLRQFPAAPTKPMRAPSSVKSTRLRPPRPRHGPHLRLILQINGKGH